MINMPSPGSAGQKWAQMTPGRQQYYVAGTAAAGPKWQAGVDGSQSNWEAGVQDAVANRRYSTGVSGKGASYAQAASTTGAQRWGQGVSQAQPKYEAGVQPIFAALSSLTLPVKGPRGSIANLQRVQAVVDAERAARR